MPTAQTITWTVLPNGATATTLKFSVHVAPRLRTDSANPTLADFPDWVDWPGTLRSVKFALTLPDHPFGVAEIPVVPMALASSARWTDMFAPASDTFVRPYSFKGNDHVKIHSYPFAHILDFLAEQYGKFGAQSPQEFPDFDDLAADDAFGPLGFEQEQRRDGTYPGAIRRAALRSRLDKKFDTKGDDPDAWALPFEPTANASPDDIALNFLQSQLFLRRDLPAINLTLPDLEPPKLDFHEVVSLTRDYRVLTRLLGLVLDFEVAIPTAFAAAVRTRVGLRVGWQPDPGTPAEVDVTPYTHCTIGKGVFQPLARPDSDLRRRQLQIGNDDTFAVVPLDLDGGAIKAMQFADNVSRSRYLVATQKHKRTAYTADSFAIPSLSTGGLAVGRKGLANQLAFKLKRMTGTNDGAFNDDGTKTGDIPEIYYEDLVRGFRWDVQDAATGSWRSLMRRTGTLHFTASGTTVPVHDDEAATVLAPTTSGADEADPPGGEPEDLYLQETLMRWSGWSLGAPRLGKPLGVDDTPDDSGNTEGDIPFKAEFTVPPGSLPPMRFGRSYRFRARAVDIAGNSLEPNAGDLSGGEPDVVSPRVIFERFEPVEAPSVLLRERAGKTDPGASSAVVVVRSETKDDDAANSSERHVVPPRASQLLPEWHGAYDLPSGGLDGGAATYADIAARDRARLEDQGQPEDPSDPGSFFYDKDEVVVTFEPCVLSPRVLVRGLPGATPSQGETAFPFADAAHPWPAFRAFRLVLAKGTDAKWGADLAGRRLNVQLAKADLQRLRISSQLDPAGLDVMGVWTWILRWAQQHGIDTAALRQRALDGRHWMLTPWRDVTLVHAVRTPLLDPAFGYLMPTKNNIGDTFASFGRNTIDVSRNSTSRLEVVGHWQLRVDNGPNSPATLPVVPGSADDPDLPRDFEEPAYTVRVDRKTEPKEPDRVTYDATQEFGDTKHRTVTYSCSATSAFVEYFRAEVTLTLGASPVAIPVAYEPTTVKVKALPDTGRVYEPAPPHAPTAGDYVVDDGAHTIARTSASTIPSGAKVAFSYVAPRIHTHAQPVQRSVSNSARPAAPDVQYVIPAFGWARPTPTSSVRTGGLLRVYLDRPWWSSGEGEKLGVVLWRGSGLALDPEPRLRPYVTMWGFDPVHVSAPVPLRPTTASFPLASALNQAGAAITLAELGSDVSVDVAGHDVGFDYERGLWYADIQVAQPDGAELDSYFPFIRLALARYQPDSIDDCHLSKVVLADVIQLAPNRSATVTGSGLLRTVTVVGRTYVGMAGRVPTQKLVRTTRVRAYLEVARADVPDEHLRWQRPLLSVDTDLPLASMQDGNFGTWRGTVLIPRLLPGGQQRLVIEEYEEYFVGAEIAPGGTRVVHTDIIPLV